MTVEDNAGAEKVLHEFERTYFERLRLAVQVLLDAAPDLKLITDPLEVELRILKERTEFILLLPEFSLDQLPWRVLADELRPGLQEDGDGDA